MRGEANIGFWLNTAVFFDDGDPGKGLENIASQVEELLPMMKQLRKEGWDVYLDEVYGGDFMFAAKKNFPDKEAAVTARKAADAEAWEMRWVPDAKPYRDEIIYAVETA